MPWSIVSGVRSSCEAVATNARRADSWRRSSSCMRASARARSPTSSWPVSRGIETSGPSAEMRSAAARRRPSRRSSVLASATASATATSRPTPAAASSALRTSWTALVTSVSRRCGDDRADHAALAVERDADHDVVAAHVEHGLLAVERAHGGEERLARRRPALGVGEEAGRRLVLVRRRQREVGDEHAAGGLVGQLERLASRARARG